MVATRADQTRSWSTRIADVSDPYIERPAPRNKPVIGFAVEERRTDGDRSTRLVGANEWLGSPDANSLRPAPRQSGPPVLPRHSARDHLSDNNRTHTVFDPARPDVPARVRVSQRNSFEDCSLQGRRRAIATEHAGTEMRQRQLKTAAEAEALATAEANELLELRSLGIRSVIAKSELDARSPYHMPDKVKGGYDGPRSPVVTRSVSAARAPPPTPLESGGGGSSAAGKPREIIETWGSGGAAAPAPAGWDLARKHYKPATIDGKPMDLDLSWIVAPLKRDASGFRPKVHPSGGDYIVEAGMQKPPPGGASPPPVAEKTGLQAVGAVAFSMPMSHQKAAARRATPIRASG